MTAHIPGKLTARSASKKLEGIVGSIDNVTEVSGSFFKD